MRPRHTLLVAWVLVAVACGGHTVLVSTEGQRATTTEETEDEEVRAVRAFVLGRRAEAEPSLMARNLFRAASGSSTT